MSDKDSAGASARRHHRRRSHRLLDCLSPHQARLPRRDSARAGAAHRGHHLACGGTSDLPARHRNADAARQVFTGPLSQARGGDRAGDRPHRLRLDSAGDDARTRPRRCAAACTWPIASASKRTKSAAAEVKTHVAAGRCRRSRGGVLFSERRARQSDGRDAGARQGRAPRRRANLREHAGDRHPHAIRAAPPACGPRRGEITRRDRGQLRRHVGARGRPHGRSQRAAAGGRALLPDLRAGARRASDAADSARSRAIRPTFAKRPARSWSACSRPRRGPGPRAACRRIFASAKYRPTGSACIRTSTRRCGACRACSRPASSCCSADRSRSPRITTI